MEKFKEGSNCKSYLNKIFLVGMEQDLKNIIEHRKLSLQEKIVFTNGCFDILHCGHLDLLSTAKQYGDVLVVGLNSNKSMIINKGRQVIDEKDRAKILSSLEFVDYVILFDEETPQNIISYLQPNILVKGSDWKGNVVGSEIVEETILVPRKLNISTTLIIKKIKEQLS